MTDPESYKEVIRQFFEDVFNEGNFEPIHKLAGGTYYFNGVKQDPQGTEQFAIMLRTRFPDLHLEINDLIGEGNSVAVRWTMTGTDKDTNQQLTTSGTNIITHSDDNTTVTNWQNGGSLSSLHPVGQKGPCDP